MVKIQYYVKGLGRNRLVYYLATVKTRTDIAIGWFCVLDSLTH